MGIDADKIRRLREKLKISQAHAAELAGVGSRQRWNNIERGRRTNITVDTLERIAAALGCKARDLLK